MRFEDDDYEDGRARIQVRVCMHLYVLVCVHRRMHGRFCYVCMVVMLRMYVCMFVRLYVCKHACHIRLNICACVSMIVILISFDVCAHVYVM